MLLLYISLISSLPKFTYILANDDNSRKQCKSIDSQVTKYFQDGIYKNTHFTKQEAKEITQSFVRFFCTYGDFDIDEALGKVESETELLLIDVINVYDDEIDFENLKKKMVVHISSSTDFNGYSNNPKEIADSIIAKISNVFQNMLLISYDAHSGSKNCELSTLLSKNSNQNKNLLDSNILKIEGEMKKKVSFLAIFNQKLKFIDDDVDCENLYLYQCNIVKSSEIKPETLLIDPYTYNQMNINLIDVNQFGLIWERQNTLRLSFDSDHVTIQYSESDSPFPDSDCYENLVEVEFSCFRTIGTLSATTRYSLYLTDRFDPENDHLPGINISINEPEKSRFSFTASDKQNIEIRTESWKAGEWDKFNTKPSINIDADTSKYNVVAPNDITVTENYHDNAQRNNRKKMLIIIIVSVCVAVIVIIVVVVVIIKCRNKYNTKIVYINDDQHSKVSLTNEDDAFKDNIDKNEEKELSDEDLEKEKKESNDKINTTNSNNNSANNLNTQSHESLNDSHNAVLYPQQSGDSHPSFPPQYSPADSNPNIPNDAPNSAYTVPF